MTPEQEDRLDEMDELGEQYFLASQARGEAKITLEEFRDMQAVKKMLFIDLVEAIEEEEISKSAQEWDEHLTD